MRIDNIQIKGFRNYTDTTVNFAEKSLIIGPNDVGKTNLIYALRVLFDKSLSERDLELRYSDFNIFTDDKAIELTVQISNIHEDCLVTVFREQIENDQLIIRYKKSINSDYVIQCGPTVDRLVDSKFGRFYLKQLHMEYVNTNRDLKSYMKREKNRILELSYSKLDEETKETDDANTKEIQNDINNINKKIDSLSYIKYALSEVNVELDEIAIGNAGQTLVFRNKESDALNLLQNLDLTYETDLGTVTLGGDGRSNQIFLATWISKQRHLNSDEKVTFYAIEEPEAHLHPQQQRKLSNYLLDKLDTQVFITTHSPNIASNFKPDSIVKLFSRNKQTQVARGGCSNELKLTFDDFGYRLNVITADVFFSGGIFLVEGPSEEIFYKELARQLNIDLDRLNLSIISVNGVGFSAYVKICLALEIPFIIRTDNDIFKQKGTERYFYAGINRVGKLYTDYLIHLEEYNKLGSIFEKYKHDLHFEYNDQCNIPEKTSKLASELISFFKEDGMFISEVDLEYDLANSEIKDQLVSYYFGTNVSSDEQLLNKMQKKKATNIYDFLNQDGIDLKILANSEIAKPLYNLIYMIEEQVKYE